MAPATPPAPAPASALAAGRAESDGLSGAEQRSGNDPARGGSDNSSCTADQRLVEHLGRRLPRAIAERERG